MKITAAISQRYYEDKMTVHIKYLELCLAHSKNSINMLLCVKKKKGFWINLR